MNSLLPSYPYFCIFTENIVLSGYENPVSHNSQFFNYRYRCNIVICRYSFFFHSQIFPPTCHLFLISPLLRTHAFPTLSCILSSVCVAPERIPGTTKAHLFGFRRSDFSRKPQHSRNSQRHIACFFGVSRETIR